MTRFEVFSSLATPGLHVWRPGTNLDVFLRPVESASSPGRAVFHCELGEAPLEQIRCQIFAWGDQDDEKHSWEQETHIKVLPRGEGNALPAVVYLFHGAARSVATDPTAASTQSVRIHLITASKYRDAELFIWGADVDAGGRRQKRSGLTNEGPFWDVALSGLARSFFLFKFFREVDGQSQGEGDYANRVYVAADGSTVWTHSEARAVRPVQPVKRTLEVTFRQELPSAHEPQLHVWQEGSDFSNDVRPSGPPNNGWTHHEVELYTELPYRIQFFNPTLPHDQQWEHEEAKRYVTLAGPERRWTLEGAPEWFAAQPVRDANINLTVAAQQPGAEIASPLTIETRVNRARAPFEAAAGLAFTTYPNVVTAFTLAGSDRPEPPTRHYLRGASGTTHVGFVVAGRAPVLDAAPAPNLFQDPPFTIKRPGAYEENGMLRFVLHAPWCALAEIEIDGSAPTAMQSTLDGAYWWMEMPVPAASYHGQRYRFVLNGNTRVQDPAAGWVETSNPGGWSKLVRRAEHDWKSSAWQTPSWDYLSLYQVHPSRFSKRSSAATALDRVRDELTNGYLGRLKFTGIQLMPVNEVGTSNSWGYDPAFYYAVEQNYGGPDALKRLVDDCHQNGIAVLLDVIFNHAGTTDNILWTTAQGTFFDGDTEWGAMINYNEPRVIHFFEENVVYLLEEYRIDGIRFDFTRVITRGGEWNQAHVRKPGDGGGWEFLHKMRQAMHRVNRNAILIAEHLPNEWAVTNFGGPMDSQWCDDFHDRLKDVCAGNSGALSGLATAMKVTHTEADNWYKATNYAESHDEVGNENGRIGNVGGFGRALRRAKVAACVTMLSRGIPMCFMGGEAGEHRQFTQGSDEALDLASYESGDRSRLVAWTNVMLEIRRGNNAIKGPSPLAVVYAQDEQLAWVRGEGQDYFIVVNFGGWSGWKSLSDLNLPHHTYRELWNSTWPAFQVEWEDEHTNGGPNARLHRGNYLHVPDYGAVVLERV